MLKNRPSSKMPSVGPVISDNVIRIHTNTIDSRRQPHVRNASLLVRLASARTRQYGSAEVDGDESGSPAWLKVPKGIAVGVALAIPVWAVLAVLVFWLVR
jgi:hypothetical protein